MWAYHCSSSVSSLHMRKKIYTTLDFALIYVLYRWWKRSCTTWDVWNLANNGINYTNLNWLAGLPSTVWTAKVFFFLQTSFFPAWLPSRRRLVPFRKGQCQLWKELLDICPGPWTAFFFFREDPWVSYLNLEAICPPKGLFQFQAKPGSFGLKFMLSRCFLLGISCWFYKDLFIYICLHVVVTCVFFFMFKELIYEKRHNVSFSVLFL